MFIYALALVFTLSVILVKGEFNPKRSVRQRAGLEGSPAALHFVSSELLTDVSETATTRRRLDCKCGVIFIFLFCKLNFFVCAFTMNCVKGDGPGNESCETDRLAGW